MGKKITDHKGVNILLAILIAATLWVYVTTGVNSGTTTPVNNISITVNGEDVLNSKGLMIDPATDLSMDLRLSGTMQALARVMKSTNEIGIAVDVTNISSAGDYTLPCKITTFPNTMTAGAVTVENSANLTIQITVTKMLSKTIDIKGVFEGKVPDGYRTNDFSINPSTITIQGPESVVGKIGYAQVTVPGQGLKETYTGDLNFTFIGNDGKPVIDPKVVPNVETVNVIVPVVKTLEVALSVDILPGGGATADDITYTISPESIQISGDEENVMSLDGKSITLGVIDLSMVTDTTTPFQFPIALSPEIANDSGVSEAVVTVTINSNLTTKTLEAKNIEIINVPAPYTATPVTQSLQVRVRGTEEDLENIADYQIRVVVDMKGQDFTPGQFRLDAKVYLDANVSAGVIGKSRVVVSVS